MIRVGFVGTGMVADLHHRAIERVAQLQLVAVTDIDTTRARTRAGEWGVEYVPTAEDMFAGDRVDAVIVLTPEDVHARIAALALEAGKHVLVEKPVGAVADIERLGRLANQQSKVCMPGHNYAYQPEFTEVRRMVRDGSLGHVRAAWITYIVKHSEDIACHYGGVLEEIMIHHSYLALALFGPPVQTYGGRMDPAWRDHQADDQAWMTWHYPKGLSVHLFASFAVQDCTSDPWLFQVKVLGDQGSAAYNWQNAVFSRPLGTLPFAIPAYEDSYIHEQKAFADAIAGADILSPLADASAAARIVAAVSGSADGRGCARVEQGRAQGKR